MVFVQLNNDYFLLAFNKTHPIFEVQPGICPALFMLIYFKILFFLQLLNFKLLLK